MILDLLLTKEEECAKKIMFEAFVPSLHEFIIEKNPTEYRRWGGNTCRQTAIFGADLLTAIMPSYEWEVWEGDFEDIHMGRPVKYQHAWILGKRGERRLLLDLSRTTSERLFIPVKTNSYPKDHEDYKNMKELGRRRLDWKTMLENDVEYYTSMPGKEVVAEIGMRTKERIDKIIDEL
jgi:hypothetical protein